jgi:hypothetical protein
MTMSGGFKGMDFGALANFNSELTRVMKTDDEKYEEKVRLLKSQNAKEYLGSIAEASMAGAFHDRLNQQIKAFDEALDQDHEVGVKLVAFGQAITFHVSALGYHNPALIFFFGETVDGEKVQLIQHISQISFVLIAIPKPKPEEPKRPFGFAQAHEPHEAPQG